MTRRICNIRIERVIINGDYLTRLRAAFVYLTAAVASLAGYSTLIRPAIIYSCDGIEEERNEIH